MSNWAIVKRKLENMILDNFTGEHNSFDEVSDLLRELITITVKQGIKKEDIEEYTKLFLGEQEARKKELEELQNFTNTKTEVKKDE